MSDNEASGTDRHEYVSYDHTDNDYAAAGAGEKAKGGKTSKWLGALLAVPLILGVLGGIFGGALPKCDSSSARNMVGDLYPQVPLNTEKATVADLTDIAETGHDEEADVRTCRAKLLDSAGAEFSVRWSITEVADGYEYELELEA